MLSDRIEHRFAMLPERGNFPKWVTNPRSVLILLY